MNLTSIAKIKSDRAQDILSVLPQVTTPAKADTASAKNGSEDFESIVESHASDLDKKSKPAPVESHKSASAHNEKNKDCQSKEKKVDGSDSAQKSEKKDAESAQAPSVKAKSSVKKEEKKEGITSERPIQAKKESEDEDEPVAENSYAEADPYITQPFVSLILGSGFEQQSQAPTDEAELSEAASQQAGDVLDTLAVQNEGAILQTQVQAQTETSQSLSISKNFLAQFDQLDEEAAGGPVEDLKEDDEEIMALSKAVSQGSSDENVVIEEGDVSPEVAVKDKSSALKDNSNAVKDKPAGRQLAEKMPELKSAMPDQRQPVQGGRAPKDVFSSPSAADTARTASNHSTASSAETLNGMAQVKAEVQTNSAVTKSPAEADLANARLQMTAPVQKPLSASRLNQVFEQSPKLTHRSIQTQVAEALKTTIQERKGEAEIRLDPAEWGKIQVKLEMKKAGMEISFVTEHGFVRDALERALPAFKQNLAQEGVNLGGVNIDVGQGNAWKEGFNTQSRDQQNERGNWKSGGNQNEAPEVKPGPKHYKDIKSSVIDRLV